MRLGFFGLVVVCSHAFGIGQVVKVETGWNRELGVFFRDEQTIIDGKRYTIRFNQDPKDYPKVRIFVYRDDKKWEPLKESTDFPKDLKIVQKSLNPQSTAQYAFDLSEVAAGDGEFKSHYARRDHAEQPWIKMSPEVETREASRATLAEMRIYDNLAQAIQLKAHEDTPFFEADGTHVDPNVHITASPRIKDAKHMMQFEIGVGFNGQAVGTGRQYVTKRKWAGATGVTHLGGRVHKDVYVTPGEITAGRLHGHPEMSFHVQSTQTNLRFFAGAGHRGANSGAMAKASVRIPQEKSKLESQIDAATTKAVDVASDEFKRYVARINSLSQSPDDGPFDVRMSSVSGQVGKKGYMASLLKARDDKERGKVPDLLRNYQPSMSMKIHQDVIRDMVSPMLAGKELRLEEVQRIICQQKFGQMLQFCKEGLDPQVKAMSVLFDESNPFDIIFDKDADGKSEIKMRLNVIHQMHQANDKAKSVLQDPTDPKKLSFQGVPYTIEVAYALKSDHATRKYVKIVESPRPEKEKEEGAHDLFSLGARAFRAWVVDPTEKSRLEEAYGQVFKERMDVPPLTIPVEYVIQEPKRGGKPELSRAGSLVPLEATAENGFLMATETLCLENNSPLGVRFHHVKGTNGKTFLHVRSVEPGSPAQLHGIQVGDWISEFSDPSQESEKKSFTEGYQEFLDSVKASASNKEADQRVMKLKWIKGTNHSMVFERDIMLCPNFIDHRKELERQGALASQLKK